MKAMINVIEAMISALIILGVMMIVYTANPVQESDMYETVYSCLIYAKNSADIQASFDQCIPSTYDFQIKTCSSSDCSATLPKDKTIISAEYIESGPELIKVWVYR